MNTFTTKSTPLLGGGDDESDHHSPSTTKHVASKRELTQAENFAISALAPSMAVLFTNPFDTVKVRLQLQGEFVKTREPGRNGKEIIRVSEKVKPSQSILPPPYSSKASKEKTIERQSPWAWKPLLPRIAIVTLLSHFTPSCEKGTNLLAKYDRWQSDNIISQRPPPSPMFHSFHLEHQRLSIVVAAASVAADGFFHTHGGAEPSEPYNHSTIYIFCFVLFVGVVGTSKKDVRQSEKEWRTIVDLGEERS